jgi:hypothetical protein
MRKRRSPKIADPPVYHEGGYNVVNTQEAKTDAIRPQAQEMHSESKPYTYTAYQGQSAELPHNEVNTAVELPAEK